MSIIKVVLFLSLGKGFFELEENLTLVKIFTPVPVCAANRPKQRLAVAVEMSVLENRNSGYT